MLLERIQGWRKQVPSVKDLKERKIEQVINFIELKKESLKQVIHTFQTVDGLFLWEVNKKLNIVARRGISQSDLAKGKITIVLSRKTTSVIATPDEKRRIETVVNQLEGFENLRLRHFFGYRTSYKEKKVFREVTRWIEIEIT
ncbi:hypothetical protein [Mesobacillus harenae]|uniref:hypothetical protein n=1 Tax=Mesobacillus harenae TaxID=2213203 RepID=UPI001580D797|nr:hypothetical protein [Mesobacillus harenae]